MDYKSKVLHLNSAFTVKELPSASDKIDSIFIEGYASTTDVDRSGDVVPASVWEDGIKNYLNNPIILFQHDHDDPIGRMVEHKVDSTGLWIKARISAAAEAFNLIKDGVVTAFSIGFRILDAEYNAAAEVFLIKKLELVEISAVSVPCNQNTLFELSKAFGDSDEYNQFKKQFAPKEESAKGLESSSSSESEQKGIWNMDPKQIEELLATTAAKAAEAATKALEERVAAQKAAEAAKAAEEAALEAKVASVVKNAIEVTQSGAEKLLAEVTKRFEDQSADATKAIQGLEAALKEKADEIAKIQASKMSFGDKKASGEASTYEEREKAFLLSKITGKAIDQTKYGQEILTKYAGTAQPGAHVANSTWELEVSTNMEAEVRRRLVVAPLLRQVAMKTNVMKMPLNPEAGYGDWVSNTAWGTTASAGSPQVHALKEITLSAYKLATREYLAYEEEEDALVVILPVVRDAMIRRVAKSVDKAYLRGAGGASDPLTGLAVFDATSVVTPTNTGTATIANLRALRKDLGAWGLDPAEIVYVVSTEVYYDLLDDTAFQTMDKVGTSATYLTGQVGSIGNSPVLVSAEFPTKAGGAATAATNIGAICLAPGNFIAGNQRGLRFDTQDLVESQQRVLVASLRTGLTQVTTNLGMGVSTLRWS